MNSLNPHVSLVTSQNPLQSSPQRTRTAASTVSLADFARPAQERRAGGNRMIAMAVAAGVQLVFFAGLAYGTFNDGPPTAAAPLEVNIIPENKEPPPPPPPPLKPALLTPVVMMNMPQAPRIYEPPPIMALPPSPKAIATAPTPVSNTGDQIDRVQEFQIKLLRHLNRHKRYPPSARARREQGVVYVRFAMDRRGNVLSAVLEKRGRSADLDAEGVALLTRAQPLPIPPAEVAGDPIEMIVPVEFSLK